jgi:eukaryotic-like serine/threonine-protein kinase
VTDAPALPDRYRLIRKLGHGGMGRVWLADDQLLDRKVALKQLITSDGETTDLDRRRRRVIREARALAKVKHPVVVPIHDLFVVKRDPWIVMQYIKGDSLDKMIDAGTPGERSIAWIGLQVLDGLAAAHKESIVHRDVKPANILVAADGAIFLIDFGIARSASDPALTGTGILGTLEYLAPERLRAGTEVGPPADIWALGATLFYALEGHSPFRRGQPDTQAILTAILWETPTLTRPGPLADITLRMLDKDPAKRADAAEVRRALNRVIAGDAKTPLRPAPPPPSAPAPPAAPAPRAAPVPRRAAAPSPSSAPPRAKAAKPIPSPRPASPRQPSPQVHPQARPERAVLQASLLNQVLRADPAKGAAMLAGRDRPTAARIIADCPAKSRGALIEGIAAADPAAAAAILPMLLAEVAGRTFGDLRPQTAASLLALMAVPEGARILGSTDKRAAASAITELPPPQACAQLRSMADRKRAAEVLSLAGSSAAVDIAAADCELARLLLPFLTEPFRTQVSQVCRQGRS